MTHCSFSGSHMRLLVQEIGKAHAMTIHERRKTIS
jgi:hypothetical protein